MTNPLLTTWEAPFGLPPFSKISESDFQGAFDEALEAARTRIDTIADNDEEATSQNTIDALELADRDLSRVVSVFFTLVATDATPGLEAMQREISPRLAAYSSEITMNAALFQRIETLWKAREDLELTEEQQREWPPEQTRREHEL